MSDNDAPSIWTLDRSAIEASLVEGRSARRDYSEMDKTAIREVLDRTDFDYLSEHGRSIAFNEAINKLNGVVTSILNPSASPSALAISGWLMVTLSTVELAVVYFGYSTSIHSYSDYVSGSFMPARDTLNIGLLQNQLMLFQLGLVVLASGILFIGMNLAVTALTHHDQVQVA